MSPNSSEAESIFVDSSENSLPLQRTPEGKDFYSFLFDFSFVHCLMQSYTEFKRCNQAISLLSAANQEPRGNSFKMRLSCLSYNGLRDKCHQFICNFRLLLFYSSLLHCQRFACTAYQSCACQFSLSFCILKN